MNQPPRKRRHDDEDGWALTLADMMTLLLCFFVIMLAIADVDTRKYSTVAESMSQAMGGKRPEAGTEVRQGVTTQKSLFAMQVELTRMLSGETDALRLLLRPDAVAIELSGGVFFRSGSAELTERARSILDKIAKPLLGTDYEFVVEGHTDNVPINSPRFPSNWELSAARASAVARSLIADGLDKNKVQVLGLADTRPLVPNATEDGHPLPANQAKNRRVLILVKMPLDMKDVA